MMHRYRIDSMKYDPRVNGNSAAGYEMNDWAQPYTNSPPSSRYGEDDASSVTHSRPRRSRLDNDITAPRAPMIIQPARPSSRKTNKHATGSVSNGALRGHNSTFNGYDLHSFQRAQYNSSRGANESFSANYPSSRNVSGYASDFYNGRAGVGLLPNKMREPRRPRSTAAEKYTDVVAKARNGFGGYESGEFSTSEDGRHQRRRESEEESEEDEIDEEEEEMRAYYLEARRAQGSRSVTNNLASEAFDGEDERYYYGVVKLGSQIVDHVLRTMPPPEDYYKLKPIERVAYLFYCAVYKKPYQNISEFHKIFNREFFKFVCAGDTNDLALFKICKSMQEQYTLKQLEASRQAYEKAKKEAEESEKLDFNQRRIVDPDDHKVVISEPEEVLSYGPLHYHSCLQFATIGVGGKLVIVRPAGTIDPASGHVLSTTSVHVDDLRSLLHSDEQSVKILESVQSFKGPLVAGQTPTHSVRLYIQRQIDSLRLVKNSGDVKKSEVVDALLIWQLLEIMVQQHGRVTGPDVATLLQNASEELSENTGIADVDSSAASVHKAEAKERFNKFLLGGHINEAVESAISDGLYADAMTLVRRLHPHNIKKIEEIETRFMNLRSIDDPFATLVSVASDQPPPILTNAAFDDGNNWKRHAAIVLANLNSPTAMQTIYHLGLLLAKRERHCAADFCLLVVCILAGYDPFIPVGHTEGEEESRKHIGLVHSGSHLLNRVDGLSGVAGFAFTDLHATDIFDYALRLGNNNVDSPLAKSVVYQMARMEYAKKLSSYGGFATDAFRYCTEVARSLWVHISAFDKDALLDLCDLADSLQYVAAATPAEIEWIGTLKSMLENSSPPVPEEQQVQQPVEEHTFSSEAQQWHDEHQAPLEIAKRESKKQRVASPVASQAPSNESYRQPIPSIPQHPAKVPPHPEQARYVSSTETFVSASESTESSTYTSNSATLMEPVAPPPMAPPKLPEVPVLTATPQLPPTTPKAASELYTPTVPPMPQHPVSVPPIPQPIPQVPQTQPMPIPIVNNPPPGDVAKSPRSELDDLWGSGSTMAAPAAAPPPMRPQPQQPAPQPPQLHQQLTSKPSVPNTKTAPPPAQEKTVQSSKNDRKASKGWFGSIKEKVIKSIPSANQMILPDDSKPSIVWDPVKQKYIGAGVEEEVVAPPPPVMSAPLLPGGGADSNKSSTNSLRSARSGLGSRYLQAGMATSQTPAVNPGVPSMMPPTMMPPMMQMPTSFGFMPAAAEDDSSEYVDPFSAEPAAPSESGAVPAQ